MNTILFIITPIISLILTILLVPYARKIAFYINLVDKPNARKVHIRPIPLVGGIVVFISSFFVFTLTNQGWAKMKEIQVLLLGTIVLLVMGIIDDKVDLRASLKLLVQFILAYFAVINGFVIPSFYGFLGIYELSIPFQYLLSLIVITGCINAFNLMDGIDGLASGLTVIGFIAFTYLAFLMKNTFLMLLFLALIGSLLGFMRYNFSKDKKIFLGDAGSLSLGFVMVTSAIWLLKSSHGSAYNQTTLAIGLGVLGLPVADALRVFRGRIKRGLSPFKADKTHLHHLILFLGMQHANSSIAIIIISGIVILMSLVMYHMLGITWTVTIMILLFAFLTGLLILNKNINDWREKLKKMEKAGF